VLLYYMEHDRTSVEIARFMAMLGLHIDVWRVSLWSRVLTPKGNKLPEDLEGYRIETPVHQIEQTGR
jgi:hypothetical protein